jgi:hypothetical protein
MMFREPRSDEGKKTMSLFDNHAIEMNGMQLPHQEKMILQRGIFQDSVWGKVVQNITRQVSPPNH